MEFFEEIRSQGSEKPFLFMSGIQIDREYEKAIELTGYPILFKPDMLKVVDKIIEEILVVRKTDEDGNQ